MNALHPAIDAQSVQQPAVRSTPRTAWQILHLVLFITVIVVGVAARAYAISRSSYTTMNGTPVLDDTFYYVTLGDNLANGRGAMIDDFHSTTAFQPLWGLVSWAVNVVWDDLDVIRALQWIAVGVNLITFFVIYFMARRISGNITVALVAAGLFFLNLRILRFSISGMEMPIGIVMPLVLMWCLYEIYQRGATTRLLIVFGILSGIGFLARVETGFLAALAGLMLFLFPVGSDKSLRARIRAPFVIGMTALIPMLPWFAFSLWMGSSIVPDSGGAVRTWAINYRAIHPSSDTFTLWGMFQSYMFHLRRNLIPLEALRGVGLYPFQLDWLVMGGIVIAAFWRRIGGWQLLTIALVWALLLLTIYSVLIPALWYFSRYAMPSAVLLTLLTIILGVHLLMRTAQRGRVFSIAATGVLIGIAVPMLTVQYLYPWVERSEVLGTPEPDRVYIAIEWINTNTPPDTIIGGWQSGMLAFYTDRPVINLDGIANRAASQAIDEGRMWEYICAANIGYIVDWEVHVRMVSPEVFNYADGAFDPRRNIEDQLVFNDANPYLELVLSLENPNNPYSSAIIARVKRENCPAPDPT